MIIRSKWIAAGLLAALAMTVTTQRTHAQKALTMTGIAMAESGGNTRNTKPKGLKATKKKQQSVAAKKRP